jgi:MYXO-CTERM domain-containing protein
VTAAPVAVDLDGDGDDELLVSGAFGVRALGRRDGARWTVAGPTRASVVAGAVAWRAQDRVLLAWGDVEGWVTVVDGATGRAQAGWPQRVGASTRVSLRVADVDGDSELDVLFTAVDGSLSSRRVRDGAAVHVGVATVRAPLVREPLVVATGDGVVHWLGLDGARALAHRALAATALDTRDAVRVGANDVALPAIVGAAATVETPASTRTDTAVALARASERPSPSIPVTSPAPARASCAVRSRGDSGSARAFAWLAAVAAALSLRRRR